MENKNIKEYYDNYTERQLRIGINERHRQVLYRIKKNGIKHSSKILEIGCGVGTLTYILAKECEGKDIEILANDISPKSVAIARKRLKKFDFIDFTEGPITEIDINAQFDMIIMADVLEHIPFSEHKKLFRILRNALKEDGLLLINIPNPHFVDFCKKQGIEGQLIENAIYTDILLENIIPADLYIEYLENYSIWIAENDYRFIVLKRNLPMESITEIMYKSTLLEKLKGKIVYELRKLIPRGK